MENANDIKRPLITIEMFPIKNLGNLSYSWKPNGTPLFPIHDLWSSCTNEFLSHVIRIVSITVNSYRTRGQKKEDEKKINENRETKNIDRHIISCFITVREQIIDIPFQQLINRFLIISEKRKK